MSTFQIKPCTEKHLPEIMAIFNEAILTSTALYHYDPFTPAMMQQWYEAKQQGNFPVFGLFNTDDELLGFGSLGTFRNQAGFKYTVEHSVYVRKDQRGKGLGKVLLQEVIRQATAGGYYVLVGVIDGRNVGSIALHEQLGFAHVGTIKQCGYKFGEWLDVVFYQYTLPMPANFVEQ